MVLLRQKATKKPFPEGRAGKHNVVSNRYRSNGVVKFDVHRQYQIPRCKNSLNEVGKVCSRIPIGLLAATR